MTTDSKIVSSSCLDKKLDFQTSVLDAALAPEEGFSIAHCLQVALVTGAVAAACFATGFYFIAVTFSLAAAWSLASALVIVLHRYAGDYFLFEEPIAYMHATMMEVNIFIASFFFYPLSLYQEFHEAQGEGDRPVLLVHGHMSFAGVWKPFRDYLKKEQIGPTYTLNMGNGDSIDKYTEQVKAEIERICQAHPGKKVTVIGHSRGGLVAAAAASELQSMVERVVTIATPFNGSKMAYLCPGDDAREMEPGSQWLIRLKEKVARCVVPFFHVAASADTVVSENSAIAGPSRRNFIVDHVGHSSILWANLVMERITREIKRAPVPPEAPIDHISRNMSPLGDNRLPSTPVPASPYQDSTDSRTPTLSITSSSSRTPTLSITSPLLWFPETPCSSEGFSGKVLRRVLSGEPKAPTSNGVLHKPVKTPLDRSSSVQRLASVEEEHEGVLASEPSVQTPKVSDTLSETPRPRSESIDSEDLLIFTRALQPDPALQAIYGTPGVLHKAVSLKDPPRSPLPEGDEESEKVGSYIPPVRSGGLKVPSKYISPISEAVANDEALI